VRNVSQQTAPKPSIHIFLHLGHHIQIQGSKTNAKRSRIMWLYGGVIARVSLIDFVERDGKRFLSRF
jgi:hypothetical protein